MSIVSKEQSLLRYFDKFQLFNNEEAEVLAKMFVPQPLKRGQSLVSEGQLWDKVYIVKNGILRFYYTTPCGKEFNKGFFSEHDAIWPLTPSSRSKPSLFTIETLSDCDVWVTSFSCFRNKLTSFGLWESFAMPLVERMIEEKFIREYEFLVKDAESRFINLQLRMGNVTERIADYHIASYLGITNVALSRIKKRLKHT